MTASVRRSKVRRPTRPPRYWPSQTPSIIGTRAAALKAATYGHVKITGGSVNVRSAPGTSSRDIGTVHKGDILIYQGVTEEADGKPWYLIIHDNANGWVSSKYARLTE